MSDIKLNLARKWRSKTFDQIVGQELSVRMLKNSLYKDYYFPVYLFSGQRGCGKTTTARIFAAAINCEQLSIFQQQPQSTVLPCLTCASCVDMMQARHPDFIEIDAASHTGVDNVRTIIDASTMLPFMRKKIYLIDEAHMLSKAACNAFLKILEEPPASVVFILATTDPHKIIETVRSRCFQLFFKPIETEMLVRHLQHICEAENINYETKGLALIAHETHGHVRDALNLLEQVRFSHAIVSQQTVLQVLGYVDDATIIQLITHVFNHKPQEVLHLLRSINEHCSVAFIWYRLLDVTRALLWSKHGVKSDQFHEHYELIEIIAKHCSLQRIHDFLAVLYEHELMLAKTTAPLLLLESVLLKISSSNSSENNNGGTSSSSTVQQPISDAPEPKDQDDEEEDTDEIEDDEDEDANDTLKTSWKIFITAIEALQEPLIISIFKQGIVKEFDQQTLRLDVEFAKDFVFFKDWLEETKQQWLPLLHKTFSANIIFNPLFTRAQQIKQEHTPDDNVKKPEIPKPVVQKQIQNQEVFVKKTFNSAKKVVTKQSLQPIDVSDTRVWQKSNLLLQYFPGTIYEKRT